MYNKVKSEQWFVDASGKSIAIFQPSLKLLREAAGAQFSNRDNFLHPTDQTVYMNGAL